MKILVVMAFLAGYLVDFCVGVWFERNTTEPEIIEVPVLDQERIDRYNEQYDMLFTILKEHERALNEKEQLIGDQVEKISDLSIKVAVYETITKYRVEVK